MPNEMSIRAAQLQAIREVAERVASRMNCVVSVDEQKADDFRLRSSREKHDDQQVVAA